MMKYHLIRIAGSIAFPVLAASWVVLLYVAGVTHDMRLFKIATTAVPVAGVVACCAADRARTVINANRR
jgi:hypothetical protein